VPVDVKRRIKASWAADIFLISRDMTCSFHPCFEVGVSVEAPPRSVKGPPPWVFNPFLLTGTESKYRILPVLSNIS
jgi:hypothetical protein